MLAVQEVKERLESIDFRQCLSQVIAPVCLRLDVDLQFVGCQIEISCVEEYKLNGLILATSKEMFFNQRNGNQVAFFGHFDVVTDLTAGLFLAFKRYISHQTHLFGFIEGKELQSLLFLSFVDLSWRLLTHWHHVDFERVVFTEGCLY